MQYIELLPLALSVVLTLIIELRSPKGDWSRGPFRYPDYFWMPMLLVTGVTAFLVPLRAYPRSSVSYFFAIANILFVLIAAPMRLYGSRWRRNLPGFLRPVAAIGQCSSFYRAAFRGAIYSAVIFGLVAATPPSTWYVRYPSIFLGSIHGVWCLILLGGELYATYRRARYYCLPDFLAATYDKPLIQDTSGPTFDFFISYKSNCANEARQIANAMMARGCRVWFAEYMIRFNSRDKFEDAIREGIARSSHGIILAHSDYWNSQHTLMELRELCRKCAAELGDKVRNSLVVIQMEPSTSPPAEYHLVLSRFPTIEYNDDADQLVTAIAKRLDCDSGWQDTTARSDENSQLETYSYKDASVELNLDGWTRHGKWNRVFSTGNIQAEFRQSVRGRAVRLVVNIGDDPQIGSVKSSGLTSCSGEREEYSAWRNYAMEWCAKRGEECVGVFLFWSQGRSHLALVSWAHHPLKRMRHGFSDGFSGGSCGWEVRYSIVLEHPVDRSKVEFHLEFIFGGNFKELCRSMSEFDRVVASARFQT